VRLKLKKTFERRLSVFGIGDYEEVMSSKFTCSSSLISKCLQLAKKYHPDMNKNDPDAQKKFQEVSEAYEVCSTGTNIVLMSILSDIGVTAVNCTSVA